MSNNLLTKNKRLLISAVLLVALFVSVFVVAQYFQNQRSVSTFPTVSFSWSTLQANTTQGGSVSINCTLFNDSNQSIKNAGFGIQLEDINNVSYMANASIWNTIFNQTFTPKTLSIAPQEQKTTVLTITITPVAPIGTYDFALQGGNELLLTVAPKQS
jgi:hypothetical protein